MREGGGEPKVIQCPNCGTTNPDGSEVCEKCGQGLLPGPQVITHDTPKLPFIKRIPLGRGPVRRG
ncbi:MAG TPA: zinc ribbon domain-containing protein [Firmicutes bacterium]|nr:zinc ribbon domain-containing protein [Bacillota bacterium]